MQPVKLYLLLPFLLLTLPSIAQDDRLGNVNTLADLYITRYFAQYPEYGTFFGIAKADNASLSDNSIKGIKKWQAFEDSLVARLKTIDKNRLSKRDVITYEILREKVEGDVGCEVCKKELWAVDQMGGWQVMFSDLADIQPVGTTVNQTNTLARWRQMAPYIQNEIANLKEGLKIKYTAPKQNVRLVIDQMNDILKQPVNQSYFYTPARKDSTSSFASELHQIIEEQIYPQLAAYRDFLTNMYIQKAREELSVSAMPNGAACYKALLRSNTTLSVSPEVVYTDGLKAVAQREAKMKKIGSKVYSTADLGKIKERMRLDTTNRFASKEELIDFSNAAIGRAKKKIPLYFNLIPTASLEIKPMADYQKAGYSYYNPVPDDGSHPATYYIQLYQFDKQDRGDVETTAFHEAYPGHHLQLAIARELVQSHPIVKYVINSGFAEGWARYTETFADEMNLYSSDRNRLATYGRLPIGMVVDPGIHLKKWTRAQAISYVLEKLPTYTRQMAESYVDRIAIWPGQMTTYGVGESLFLKLRSKAQTALGKSFGIKTFHDKCLDQGTVPLNLLEQHIMDWLKKDSANKRQAASRVGP
ncbi:DUF885 domain-containing protein [Larkinella harenae]